MDMPPMMRGRGSHPGIRPSSYQFHPDFFLYKGNMLNIVHYRIIPAIINTMPAHVREGFRGIMASRGPAGDGARDPERERKADVTAQRMRENATQLGFRAPNTGEKARACTYHLRAFLRSNTTKRFAAHDLQVERCDRAGESNPILLCACLYFCLLHVGSVDEDERHEE